MTTSDSHISRSVPLALLALAATVLTLPVLATAAPKPPPAPHQLTIAVKPGSVVFGRTVTLTGKLTGDKAAGETIELEESPHPSTAFRNAAQVKAAADGSYTFTRTPALATRYRVTAKTGPPTTSAVVAVAVQIRVSFRVSDSTPRAGQLVRFSGRACPTHDGARATVQRRTPSGAWRTVRTAKLTDAPEPCSRYSGRMRVSRSGSYRVRVAGDADHRAGVSRRRTLRVG